MNDAKLIETIVCLARTGTVMAGIRKCVVGLALRGALDGDEQAESPEEILKRFAVAREAAIRNGVKRQNESSDATPLPFPRGRVPVERLTNLAIIEKGATGIQSAKPGPYPLVVTAAGRGSCDHFDFEGPAAIVPLVSSTGHGHASIHRLHYQEGRFALGNILCAIRPLLPDRLSARFIYEYLTAFKEELLVSSMVGTANVSLTLSKVGAVPVAVVSVEAQRRVDQLMALCDDLEARQAKKREIGTRLTKSALEALTTAEGPAEFDAAWKRVVGNFSILIDTSEKVPELRGAIRNLALRGALTERGEAETTGAAMLERIEAERERRVRAKQARRTDPILAVSGDDVPFPVPKTWAWARLGHLCWKVADGPHFSPKYVEREQGVPFLSGRNIRIEGFELDDMKYVSPADHQAFCQRTKPERGDVLYTKGGTTGVALVNDLDFEFSVWVHVAVLKLDLTNVDPQYVAMALNSPHCYQQSQKYTHGTGNRDLGLTRMVLITLPLPPLEEQKRIVARVAQLMKVCDDLEAKLRHAEDRAAKLAEAVVRELVA